MMRLQEMLQRQAILEGSDQLAAAVDQNVEIVDV